MNIPEKITAEILQKIGFFIKPFKELSQCDAINTIYSQFKLDRFYLDFALPKQKIAIEVNGCYYHPSNSTLTTKQIEQKLKHNIRNQYLFYSKWEPIYLTELFLQNNNCHKILLKFIFNLIEV